VLAVLGLLGKKSKLDLSMTVLLNVMYTQCCDLICMDKPICPFLNDWGALHYAVGFRGMDQVAGWMA